MSWLIHLSCLRHHGNAATVELVSIPSALVPWGPGSQSAKDLRLMEGRKVSREERTLQSDSVGFQPVRQLERTKVGSGIKKSVPQGTGTPDHSHHGQAQGQVQHLIDLGVMQGASPPVGRCCVMEGIFERVEQPWSWTQDPCLGICAYLGWVPLPVNVRSNRYVATYIGGKRAGCVSLKGVQTQ